MKHLYLRCAAGLLVVQALGAPVPEAPPQPAPIRAGFAESDITPEIGMEMPGNYGKVCGRSIHDPCKVRVAVFDDGRRRVALIGVDALLVRRPLVVAVRQQIEQRCGIPPAAVLIGASHSHSSGPTGMVLPGEFDHASPLVQRLAYEQSSAANPDYLRRVEAAIVAAAVEASGRLAPARLGFGSGREDKVSFNRRHHMRNGQTWTHPGKGNPDMLEYAGPIDPDVGVLGAWDAGGQMLGCVVNFACHATTSPPGFSANWIYYLERTLRGTFGSGVTVVFLQGPCGDITQVDNLDPHANPDGDTWAQRVGGCVGAEAVKALLLAERGTNVALDARTRTLTFERRRPDPARVRRALEQVQQPEAKVGHTEWIFAKETVLLDALATRYPKADVEVQALEIGPILLFATPAEYFVAFGLEMKRRSPFKLTFPVELANDCIGYVPTEEALGMGGGGYETRLTSYSNLEPAAGRRMLEAGLEMARQLEPGPVPLFEPPAAPPFGSAWSYGNVPPEP
jgi:hypothetical protein